MEKLAPTSKKQKHTKAQVQQHTQVAHPARRGGAAAGDGPPVPKPPHTYALPFL